MYMQYSRTRRKYEKNKNQRFEIKISDSNDLAILLNETTNQNNLLNKCYNNPMKSLILLVNCVFDCFCLEKIH